MSFGSVAITNIFLACIALCNVVILAILYETSRKKK